MFLTEFYSLCIAFFIASNCRLFHSRATIILIQIFQQIGRIFTESVTRIVAAAQRLFFESKYPTKMLYTSFYLNKVRIWAEAQLFS